MIDFFTDGFGDGVICVFGFLLHPEQQTDLITLQQSIGQQAELKYRFSEHNPPYVRLYECVLPEKNVPIVQERIKDIALHTSAIPMKWGEIEESVHSIILWGERNEVLLDFQREIVEAVQPYREGYFKQKYKEMEYLTPLEKESVEKWGWPWVESYEPYVVIAKPTTRFPVGKIDLVWGHSKAILEKFFVGQKHDHYLIRSTFVQMKKGEEVIF